MYSFTIYTEVIESYALFADFFAGYSGSPSYLKYLPPLYYQISSSALWVDYKNYVTISVPR